MRIRYSFSSRRTGTIEGGNAHKISFPAVAREVIRISDIILEVLDARFIKETRNLEIEDYVKSLDKKLIYLINKCDIGNEKEIAENIEKEKLFPHILVSCKSGQGRRQLRDTIKMEAKRLKSDRQTNIGIIGYPNTGKSSIINFLVGSGADTSKESGFTKGMKKLKLNKNIAIIDTPGVLGEDTDKKTAFWATSADQTRDPMMTIVEIMKKHPGVIERNYNIENVGDPEHVLTEIAKRKKFLKKKGEPDLQRAARLILGDWQLNKIYK